MIALCGVALLNNSFRNVSDVKSNGNCDSPRKPEQEAVMSRLVPNTEKSLPKVLKRKAMYIDDEEVEETRERLETMEIDGAGGDRGSQ